MLSSCIALWSNKATVNYEISAWSVMDSSQCVVVTLWMPSNAILIRPTNSKILCDGISCIVSEFKDDVSVMWLSFGCRQKPFGDFFIESMITFPLMLVCIPYSDRSTECYLIAASRKRKKGLLCCFQSSFKNITESFTQKQNTRRKTYFTLGATHVS